ncbi:MAG: tetratricopeptide repeat protein [Planctomycetales bacterium]|nr:tetratricopeptide repeat protein [Planctomycetales bacterium]
MLRFPSLRGWLSAAVIAACLLTLAPAQAQITNDLLIGNAVSAPDSSRYSDVKEAIDRYGKKDIIGAQTFFERAKSKNPKLPPVAVMMAKLHQLAGNAQAIRPALDECVSEAPDDPEPYLILAEEAVRAGFTIEADALYDKAVLLMEKFEDNAKRKRDFAIRAYTGRTRIAQRRRKWDQAESDLKKLLTEDPECSNAHMALGQVMFLVDPPRAEEGIKAFQEAKKLNPDIDHPYVSAGKTLASQGKTEEAMKYFSGAYRNAKDDEGVALAYAQALLREGKGSEAAPVIKGALAKNKDSASLWLLSAVEDRMRGDNPAAEQDLLKTISLAPTLGPAYEQLAQVLIDSSDDETKKRALGFAATCQKLNPNSASANITLAWTLYQNGQAREAVAILQKLQMRNLDPDASLLLAKILIENNQIDGAKKVLSTALEDTRNIFVNRDEATKLLSSLD